MTLSKIIENIQKLDIYALEVSQLSRDAKELLAGIIFNENHIKPLSKYFNFAVADAEFTEFIVKNAIEKEKLDYFVEACKYNLTPKIIAMIFDTASETYCAIAIASQNRDNVLKAYILCNRVYCSVKDFLNNILNHTKYLSTNVTTFLLEHIPKSKYPERYYELKEKLHVDNIKERFWGMEYVQTALCEDPKYLIARIGKSIYKKDIDINTLKKINEMIN